MLLCILSMPIVLMNCGYRFSQGGEHIAPDIRQVYVDTFINDTGEAYVENYVRNGFIEQFRRSNRFRITDGKETADAVLTGTVKSIVLTPLASDRFDKATENRVWMTVGIQFKERRSGNVIYLNPALTGEQSFLMDQADTNRSSINKSAALQKLSLDLAEKGFRLLMSGF
jgi:hypothetical protein